MHSIDDPRRRQMLSLYIHRCSTSESILSRPIRRIIAIVGRVSFAVTFILSRSLFIFLLLPSRFTIRYTSPPPLAALWLLSRLPVRSVFLYRLPFSVLHARLTLCTSMYLSRREIRSVYVSAVVSVTSTRRSFSLSHRKFLRCATRKASIENSSKTLERRRRKVGLGCLGLSITRLSQLTPIGRIALLPLPPCDIDGISGSLHDFPG